MQIFKEKRGTFAYRVEIGRNPKTGRRLQKYKGGFRREKDAKAAAQQIEEEVRQHRYVPDSQTTFGDFAEEWLQIYGETVKPGSVRIRRHQVGILLMYFEQVPLQLITPKKYEKALLSVFRSYSRNTAEGVHGAARMIFKKARQYGLMRADPSEFFSLPRENQKSGKKSMRRSRPIWRSSSSPPSSGKRRSTGWMETMRCLPCLHTRGYASGKLWL